MTHGVKMKPTSIIKANLGIQPNGPVQVFFTNTCYRYMDKYVPMKDGNLRTIVDITNNKIVYESPYARYQYYGQREDGSHKVVNYTTPGTGTYWDKRMWSAEKDDVIQEVQEFINKHGGK